MSDRSFQGGPLDGTQQWISERPYKGSGNTVDGSPGEFTGQESTTLGGETSLQDRILRERLLSPSITVTEIARRCDCDKGYVSRVLNRSSALHDRDQTSVDDLSELQSKIVHIRALCPDRTQRQIAEQVDASEGHVSRTVREHSELIAHLRAELSDYTDHTDQEVSE